MITTRAPDGANKIKYEIYQLLILCWYYQQSMGNLFERVEVRFWDYSKFWSGAPTVFGWKFVFNGRTLENIQFVFMGRTLAGEKSLCGGRYGEIDGHWSENNKVTSTIHHCLKSLSNRESNGLLIIQEGEAQCLEKMKWVRFIENETRFQNRL